jgi:peptidoglycan/LPS O-acetylase OafA/YrhL
METLSAPTVSSASSATRHAPQLPSVIPSLGGMRAISILLVVVAHCLDRATTPQLYAWFGHGGNYGVRVFFVISGFLITTLLLREYDKTGSISLRDFYIRRALRIFPAFYIFVAVIWALSALGHIHLKPGDLLHSLTYTMNYHMDRSWYLNHIWSLSVEEQFYLLWPLTLMLVKPEKGVKVVLGVLLAVPLIRVVMYFGFDASGTMLARHFQAVADALGAGCLLALLFNRLGASSRYQRWVASPYSLLLAAILMVLPVAGYKIHQALYYVPGQTVANIGIALLLDRVIRRPGDFPGPWLNTRPMEFIGAISYSMYLWQELFLDREVPGMQIPFPMNAILTFAASVASYYLIEQQFLKLKGRFTAR